MPQASSASQKSFTCRFAMEKERCDEPRNRRIERRPIPTSGKTDSSGKLVETGKYLSVSKKEGGKWFYIRDTWNADSAPQQPQAAAKK